jgi:hypothetical protein
MIPEFCHIIMSNTWYRLPGAVYEARTYGSVRGMMLGGIPPSITLLDWYINLLVLRDFYLTETQRYLYGFSIILFVKTDWLKISK